MRYCCLLIKGWLAAAEKQQFEPDIVVTNVLMRLANIARQASDFTYKSKHKNPAYTGS